MARLRTFRSVGLVGLTAVPILGHWLAPVSGVADSLSVGLPLAGCVALILSLIFLFKRKWWHFGLALVLTCAGALPLSLLVLPTTWGSAISNTNQSAAPAPELRLMQHNIWILNKRPLLLNRSNEAEILTLQEVSPKAHPALKQLEREGWALQVCRNPKEAGASAVASRWPALASGCLDSYATWAQINTDVGPVTVVSLHLTWPWPWQQHQQVSQIAQDLSKLPRPIIVAGDFNQTPWSGTIRKISAASDTAPIRGIRNSYTLANVWPLPIDHVLLPIGWPAHAQLGPRAGSDHKSIEVTIGVDAPHSE